MKSATWSASSCSLTGSGFLPGGVLLAFQHHTHRRSARCGITILVEEQRAVLKKIGEPALIRARLLDSLALLA